MNAVGITCGEYTGLGPGPAKKLQVPIRTECYNRVPPPHFM